MIDQKTPEAEAMTTTPETESTAAQATEAIQAPSEGLQAKNRELLTKVKTAKVEIDSLKAALQATEERANHWQAKWHDVAVMRPFDASLETASACPEKYLRAELIERGIVKMELDDDGILHPVWYKDGHPENESPKDVRRFLADLNDPIINTMVKSSGASGSGATKSMGASHYAAPAQNAAPAKENKPTQFGLR